MASNERAHAWRDLDPGFRSQCQEIHFALQGASIVKIDQMIVTLHDQVKFSPRYPLHKEVGIKEITHYVDTLVSNPPKPRFNRLGVQTNELRFKFPSSCDENIKLMQHEFPTIAKKLWQFWWPNTSRTHAPGLVGGIGFGAFYTRRFGERVFGSVVDDPISHKIPVE